MKILIVDDDFFFQKGISFFLIDSGHEVRFALHGQKALDIVEKNPDIELIICDVDMPVMMGPEFILEINQIYKKNRPLILVVSGVNNASTFLSKLEIEYDYYFEKPLDVNEFAKTLTKITEEVKNRNFLRN